MFSHLKHRKVRDLLLNKFSSTGTVRALKHDRIAAKRGKTRQNAAKRGKMLQCAAKRHNLPQNAAIHRNSPQFPAIHHKTPQNAAIRRKTRQYAAKRRKTPQNAAKHRKTLFCTTSSTKTWNLACNWDLERLGTVIHAISPTQNSFPTHLGYY